MKITKEYLKQIIKEEFQKINEELGDINNLKNLLEKFSDNIGKFGGNYFSDNPQERQVGVGNFKEAKKAMEEMDSIIKSLPSEEFNADDRETFLVFFQFFKTVKI